MNIFRSLLIPFSLAAGLLGCSDADDKKSDATPDQTSPFIVAEDNLAAETPIQSLSEIVGHWDIIRFNHYEPVGLSSDGKNNAFVTFRPKSLGFMIGCNGSGLEAELTASGVLENKNPDDGMVETQMGCSPEKHALDEEFFEFFNSQPKISARSASLLSLTTKKHELLLQKRETTPDQLNGFWQLRYVDGANVSYTSIPTPDTPRYDYLMFSVQAQDASVGGYDGCNHGGGSVTFDKQSMAFGTRISDSSRCIEGLQPLSDHYRDASSYDVHFEIDGNYLIITANSIVYEFERLEAAPKRTSLLGVEK